MPSFFNRPQVTLFEIRLDNPVIILRGSENEAASQMLQGAVVLCLTSALKIEDVHLRMTGELKVGWSEQRITPTGVANNRVDRTNEIFNHRWPPFVSGSGGSNSSKGMILPAGNYEWPFELVIPGSFRESVEGLTESHVVYKLKATVARGKLAYDIHAYKPVRIVRTLDPSALELAHAMTVENVWPNKIEYQLIIPQKAIVFGTSIQLEMQFTSLLKGLRIGLIKVQLQELQEFSIPSISAAGGEIVHKNTRNVENWQFELNEDNYRDILNEEGQDGWVLNEWLPLPKRLSKCMQDVDMSGIRIKHKVKFNIMLHNPDGHVSELRATLPVTIFISPNMPLSEEGVVLDQTPMQVNSSDIAQHAPPLYGQHVLDQLYADFDPSGLMTPAPQSGMNTPFNALSRRGSHEDLVAAGNATSNGTGSVPPATLTSILQNLDADPRHRPAPYAGLGSTSGGNTPFHPHHAHVNSSHNTPTSAPQSNPLSRRTSEEDSPHSSHIHTPRSGHHTPENLEIDYSDLSELCKVPSYHTAVKAPIRGINVNDSLPNYDAAVSAPPTPERAFSAPVTPGAVSTHGDRHRSAEVSLGEVMEAHGTERPRNPQRSSTGSRLSNLVGLHPPAPVHVGDTDERRRLHFLQRNR
ncbi:carbon catabolite repression protein-like protein cred [Xylogone sp. PMI_703]|nr:carbon catabolite repression protein-like protein cred [Xylogone sp. PMI_703]